jgi:hypothetical protein
VTGGGPGLVAVGWDERDVAVWTSTDGLTWLQVPHDEAVFGAARGWGMVSVSTVGSGLGDWCRTGVVRCSVAVGDGHGGVCVAILE